MSGILKNSLRLVGTAKFATNNSTYLRSMMLTTNRLNHTLPALLPNYSDHNKFNKSDTQAERPLTNFWKTIRTSGKKILSIFTNDKIKTSSFGPFEVSLSTSNSRLITQKKLKNLILPPKFNTKLNGRPIEPKSNKTDDEEDKTLSFKLGKWNVLLDGYELKLNVNDLEKTFIVKHAVYVKAHKNPPKIVKNGGILQIPLKLDSQMITYPAKIISTSQKSGTFYQEYLPSANHMTTDDFLSYGQELPESSTEKKKDEITDKPNNIGQVKLQFPMAVSLEGAPQEIKVKDTDDTFTIYHTVDIEAYTDSYSKVNNLDKKKDRTSDVGILRIALESGDIKITSTESAEQMIIMRQEVDILIDLDSEIPSISVHPLLKNVVAVDSSK